MIGKKKRAQLFGRTKNGKPITRKDPSVSPSEGETEDIKSHDSWLNTAQCFFFCEEALDTVSSPKEETEGA